MKKVFCVLLITLTFSCSSSDDNIINDPSNQSPCATPEDLEANNITETIANLTWSANTNSDLFNIEYGALGFTLGNGITINSNSENKIISGLTSGTTYDFYVRTNCGGNETSSWAGPHSFVTD